MDEVSSLDGAPFDDEVSSPTVFGDEVRQQLDEAPCGNSPEVVCFHPDRVTDETKLSEVDRFLPDGMTEETKLLSSDNVSDKVDRAEKSLYECLLDKAKSSDDNVSDGANEAIDDGVYEADEVFERRRPARQRKRPSKYEGFETQFASGRMRASRRNFVESSSSYKSSRVLARGSIQHSSKSAVCQADCLNFHTIVDDQTPIRVDEPTPEIRTMVRSCERSPLQHFRTMVRSRGKDRPLQYDLSQVQDCDETTKLVSVPKKPRIIWNSEFRRKSVINEDGRPIGEILKAKLRGYNKRPKRSGGSTAALVKTKKSREFVSTSTSSSSTPQRPRSSPAAALGRPPSVSTASSPKQTIPAPVLVRRSMTSTETVKRRRKAVIAERDICN